MIRIAIVDDHALFLGGLSLAIRDARPDWTVETFASPVPLLSALDEGKRFELIISDLLMQDMNGLAFAKTAGSKFGLPVLLISGVNTPPSRAELSGSGVRGFLHKSSDPKELLMASDAILGGEEYFGGPDTSDSDGTENVFGLSANDQFNDAAPIAAIKGRQLDVLRLVAQGASNKDIARILEISENTVKTHLRHIFHALGVSKRTACIRAAKLQGLLE